MPHLSANRFYLAATVSALILGTLVSLGTILIRNGDPADCRITSSAVSGAAFVVETSLMH
ncbi:MAG TPA: hypothetical protein VNR65_09065 [Geobacterales bacterium]|nr:hypothetical protein [Geobacterales bacterium]